MRFLALLILPLFLASGAFAQEIIERKGGNVTYRPVGDWYPYKQWYEDGSIVCYALSFSSRNGPIFAFELELGARRGYTVFTLTDRRDVPDNTTATLELPGREVRLVHAAIFPQGRYFPYSNVDNDYIDEVLPSLRTPRFFVQMEDGRRFRFATRKYEQAKQFLIDKCAR